MQVDYHNLELARSGAGPPGQRPPSGHEGPPGNLGQLGTWARLESSDLGMILQVFKPANDILVDVGDTVLEAVQKIYSQGASSLDGVINTYLDADKQAHELLQGLAATMGHHLPSYQDPRDNPPSLGAARDDAGPYYRAGNPNLFQRAYEDGYRAGDTVRNERY